MSGLSIKSVLVAVALSLGTACYADSRKDVEAAVALYNQQKFSDALAAFAAVAEKNPGEPGPVYYEANCQIALGRTATAISLYKIIVSKFPKSAEAASARSVLQRMGVKGAEVVGTKSEKVESGKAVAGTTRRGARTSMSAEEKESVIDKLVVPVRALADRPNVSAYTINSIKEALTQYPTPLLSMLYRRNCKIYVTPTMIDKEPGLVNTKPSGYEDGSTFRNCPGMFDGDVVLCEKAFVGDGPDLADTSDIIGTLRHELGHAVDRYAGRLTATDNFKHQYLLDLGTIDDDTKNKLAYFCQKDRRGPAETFAELMCSKYGGRPNGNKRTDLVNSSFKLTRAYLDSIVNEIDGSKPVK